MKISMLWAPSYPDKRGFTVTISLKNKLPEGGEPLGADCVSTVVAC